MRSRMLTTALSAIALAAAVTACGNTTPAEDSATSGEVTVMGYAGVFEDNYTKAVIEPFEKQHPDIDVVYEPAESSSQMLAGLRAQKAAPSADVSIMDVSVAGTGNDEGIFQPLDPQQVTNLADVADRGRTPGNYGPAVTFDNLVLLYDTKRVPEAPTSWDALWGKDVRGQVVLDAAPDIQGLSLMLITAKMLGTDYKKTVDPAIDRLAELAPAVQTWSPNPDPYTMITNGSASMAIGWNARAQYYSDQSKGRLGVTLPKEGSVFQINTINLTKKSDSPKAAQTFINYALGPQAQKSFTETMFYAPVNTKTQVGAKAMDRTATSSERQAQIIDVDWSYVAEHNDQWTERWRREILGG